MTLITPKIEHYLRDIVIPLRLSCVSASGWPVVLSLWYLYRDGLFYCATQETARVVSYLRHEPRCAFEIAADHPPYCGVRGQGTATIDTTSGVEILEHLLVRYLGSTETRLGKRLLAQSHNEVAIVIGLFRRFGAMRENGDHKHHVRKRHMTGYRSDALKKHDSLRFAWL